MVSCAVARQRSENTALCWLSMPCELLWDGGETLLQDAMGRFLAPTCTLYPRRFIILVGGLFLLFRALPVMVTLSSMSCCFQMFCLYPPTSPTQTGLHGTGCWQSHIGWLVQVTRIRSLDTRTMFSKHRVCVGDRGLNGALYIYRGIA